VLTREASAVLVREASADYMRCLSGTAEVRVSGGSGCYRQPMLLGSCEAKGQDAGGNLSISARSSSARQARLSSSSSNLSRPLLSAFDMKTLQDFGNERMTSRCSSKGSYPQSWHNTSDVNVLELVGSPLLSSAASEANVSGGAGSSSYRQPFRSTSATAIPVAGGSGSYPKQGLGLQLPNSPQLSLQRLVMNAPSLSNSIDSPQNMDSTRSSNRSVQSSSNPIITNAPTALASIAAAKGSSVVRWASSQTSANSPQQISSARASSRKSVGMSENQQIPSARASSTGQRERLSENQQISSARASARKSVGTRSDVRTATPQDSRSTTPQDSRRKTSAVTATTPAAKPTPGLMQDKPTGSTKIPANAGLRSPNACSTKGEAGASQSGGIPWQDGTSSTTSITDAMAFHARRNHGGSPVPRTTSLCKVQPEQRKFANREEQLHYQNLYTVSL